jgi:predicted secreted hydrolase
MKKLLIILSFFIAALIVLCFLLKVEKKAQPQAEISLAETLSSDTSGFSQANKTVEFAFPKDHGPHNNFKTEWWYFTGNLASEDGKNYGYQLTIFRMAMSADSVYKNASFASNQSYMAHFTISDIDKNDFYYYEKISRGAAGLAGAEYSPLKVWLHNYKIEQIGKSSYGLPLLRLYAEDDKNAIDLILENQKPVVLHGNKGLSYKSPDSSAGSYYYSFTRINTQGEIKINGKRHKVRGLSWLDREWSSGSLTREQSGWDWYSLQLEDNTEIMIYVLRGKKPDYVYAAYIDEKGIIKETKTQIKVSSKWKSPSGSLYPSEWNIKLPELGLDINVKPRIPGQELRLSFRYWEGAVSVTGFRNNKPVKGSGYVELTGY